MSRFYLTPGGAARLRARIANARAAYQAIVADNPAALESGDTSGWHDNFAFEENQRQMHRISRLVTELERTFGQATLIPLPRKVETAVIGTRVEWKFLDEDKLQTCWIAGWDDGDPDEGRVSYNSPLGKAIVGAEIGEERSVELGKTRRMLEVVSIAPISAQEDEGGFTA